MEKYLLIGEKKVVNGDKVYSPDYHCYDGTFGTIYKDYRSFHENPDEVCYIPEYAFEDVEPIVIDGKNFYPIDGYTRKDLEELIKDEVDDEGDEINLEAFFNSLWWCYPETRLNELI